MKVAHDPQPRTLVRLPADVSRPFEVFVNGVPQVEGRDYTVRSGTLVFDRALRGEGKLGAARWTSMVLVVYQRDGRPAVASKLPLEWS
jgi:hypothetical protein